MSEAQDERARRLAKVDAERAQGRDPYPVRFDRTHTAAELHADFDGVDAGAETDDVVRIAGRLLLIRRQGKLTFATVRDGTGTVQLFVSRGVLGDERHAEFDDLDLGDWVGAEGSVLKTSFRSEIQATDSTWRGWTANTSATTAARRGKPVQAVKR